MTTAAVVLAAGASTRLGEPKQSVRWGERTLLERSLDVARVAGLDPVVVVLGSQAAQLSRENDLRSSWIVVHPRWSEGMASSVRAGMELVQGFAEVDGVVLLTCDMPRVPAAHLRALVACQAEIAGSGYAGSVGVPAYFARAKFDALLRLTGDAGARSLLLGAAVVPLDPATAQDIDTADDVRELHFGGRSDGSGGGKSE